MENDKELENKTEPTIDNTQEQIEALKAEKEALLKEKQAKELEQLQQEVELLKTKKEQEELSQYKIPSPTSNKVQLDLKEKIHLLLNGVNNTEVKGIAQDEEYNGINILEGIRQMVNKGKTFEEIFLEKK